MSVLEQPPKIVRGSSIASSAHKRTHTRIEAETADTSHLNIDSASNSGGANKLLERM